MRRSSAHKQQHDTPARCIAGARLLLALAACHAGSSSSSSPPSACAGQRLVAARSPGPGDCSAAAWAFVALRQPLEQRPAHWGAQVGGERAHARNAVATPAARSARLGRGLCCSAKTETAHDVAVGDPARSPAPLPMPASTPAEALVLEEIEWHDTWFDRLLQRVLRDRILRALAQGPQGDDAAGQGEDDAAPRVAHKGSSYIVGLLGGERGHEDYDSMISAALMLSRKPGPDTRARTLSLLYDLFPSWFAPAFGAFLSWWPMWFDARHAGSLPPASPPAMRATTPRTRAPPGCRESPAAAFVRSCFMHAIPARAFRNARMCLHTPPRAFGCMRLAEARGTRSQRPPRCC